MDIQEFSETIVPVLKNYSKELDDFNDYMEELYSNIANMLPNLEESVKEESQEIRSMLDFMIRGVEGSGVLPAIKEIELGLSENFEFLEGYIKNYSKISTDILKRLESMGNIQNIISQMKQISREIRLFSINSVIVSSRAGSEGIGFKSISRFIIELSDEIQKTAFGLENYSQEIMLVYNKIKAVFSELFEKIYKEKMQNIKIEIKAQIQKSIRAVEEVYRILNDVLKRINLSLEEIPGVMQNLQKQDIVKQALEHVQSIFAQIFREDSVRINHQDQKDNLHFSSYIIFTSDKVNQDLNNTQHLVKKTNKAIHDNFQTIFGTFSEIKEDQENIVGYFTDSYISERSNGFLKEIFGKLKKLFKSYEQVLTEEVQLKQRLVGLFDEMRQIYSRGSSFFSVFEKFFSTMNNINVLAQIEMNKKSVAGQDSSGIKQKFSLMLESLKDFKEKVRENLQRTLSSLIKEMGSFSETQKEQSLVIDENIHFLDKNIYELDSIYSIVAESLENIVGSGRKMLNLIEESFERLFYLNEMDGKIRELTSNLNNKMMDFKGRFSSFCSEKSLNEQEYFEENPYILDIQRSKVNLDKHIEEKGDVELF